MKELYDYIDEVQDVIGYEFNNQDLLAQAFTRSSYSTQYGGENNEVLEFLGDRILDFYVVKIIADEFGSTKSHSDYYDPNYDDDEFFIAAHKNESTFTELKKEIVSNKNLAKRIDELELAQFMFLGDSDLKNHVERVEKVKADLFEAILGAIAIDSNWDPETLENAVGNLLEIGDFFDGIEVEEERPDRYKFENAITTLKEMGEHGYCSIPEYTTPDEQVVQKGKLWWSCTCYVRNWGIRETGLGTSKKTAKRYAAYLVLCKRFNLQDEFEENGGDD